MVKLVVGQWVMPTIIVVLLSVSVAAESAKLNGTACDSGECGVTLKLYDNTALYGDPSVTHVLTTTSFEYSSAKPFSAEMVGTVSFPTDGKVYDFNCTWTGSTMGYVWIDGHMVCQDGNTYTPGEGTTDNPLPVNIFERSAGPVTSMPFRAHFYYSGGASTDAVSLSILWSTDASSGSIPIPTESLTPVLPAPEAQRDKLQRAAATGWGSWLHSNLLCIIKLPEAALVSTELCRKSSQKCSTEAVPDGARPHPGRTVGPEIRVGLHAYDQSYVQYYFGPYASAGVTANVSVEYSASGEENGEIDALITPIECNDTVGVGGQDCSDFEIVLVARYAWLKAGSITPNKDGSLTFSPAGLPSFTLYTTLGSGVTISQRYPPSNDIEIHLSLAGGAVGFSSAPSPTVTKIAQKLEAMRQKEEQLLLDTFGQDRMGEGAAVKASAMWTLVSTPAENGGAPLMPVSRVWNFAPDPVNADFTYAIFDWDNLFASLLAASGARNDSASNWGGFQYSISNLFQVVKSKTAAGFVPNFAAGGTRSQDRTEPPIGAKVLLTLLNRFGYDKMGWVVEALFDDLLDWNDWFLRKRLKPPLKMIALGTYNDQTKQAGNMQDARYESGLDNSPMYDGTFYNDTNGCGLLQDGCGLMQLYDVGMTSMWVQEAFSLATLADAIKRPSELSHMLRSRGQAMAKKISEHLWNNELENFVNRFSSDHDNGTFYEHISPTSFYALQAMAATDEQAARMAEAWLLNKSRFCLTTNGTYTGNSDTCYWGLPSISADDPAYPRLGYWRGYIWGPMVQLTYWSLQNYDHVPQIRTARKSLCKQMAGLMMSQWNQHRHICENYNPHKTADTTEGDCSGTRFYHWGALTGVVGLMEDGLF